MNAIVFDILAYAKKLKSVGFTEEQVQYKLDTQRLKLAQNIVTHASIGPMLAPQHISGYVAILSSKYPQIAVRGFALNTWLASRGGEKAHKGYTFRSKWV